MKQETFTDIEYSFRKKKTKREEFLEIMDEIIPWDEWVGVIAPYYPKGKACPNPARKHNVANYADPVYGIRGRFYDGR